MMEVVGDKREKKMRGCSCTRPELGQKEKIAPTRRERKEVSPFRLN